MRHIIFWELSRRRTALIWWSIASVGTVLLILSLYPSIRDQAQQMNQVLNQLPESIRSLKTGNDATINLADPIGFIHSQLFYSTLPIMWIILAITRGSGILGRDEQDRTLELVLARPVSRSAVLAAKAISLWLELVIIGGFTLAALLIFAPIFDMPIAVSALAAATAYTALFSLSFGYIAFGLQAASSLTRRLASAVAVLIGFGSYILTSLGGLTDWLAIPARFAPFYYFSPEKIMHGQAVTGLNVYLVGIFVVMTVLAFVGFSKRDIT